MATSDAGRGARSACVPIRGFAATCSLRATSNRRRYLSPLHRSRMKSTSQFIFACGAVCAFVGCGPLDPDGDEPAGSQSSGSQSSSSATEAPAASGAAGSTTTIGDMLDCRADSSCMSSGKCTEALGNCVAASDEDCRASDFCALFGTCSLGNGTCVAGSDADCSNSIRCEILDECVLSGTKCTDAMDDTP